MKLVTLNLWGGRVCEKYPDFFAAYPGIDIWCFQEVFHKAHPSQGLIIDTGDKTVRDWDIIDTLSGHLPSHFPEFCPTLQNSYGIAIFLRDSIRVIERGEILVASGNWDDVSDMYNRDHDRKLQWVLIEIGGEKIAILNTHLTHRPEGKIDSEKRLRQSKFICDQLNRFDYPTILVGDFNLRPDTESINMIEKQGMKNLIKEYRVASTRTELYKKPIRLADYIFVSEHIKVNEFKVLSDVVSDHNPVYLDFDIV